MNSLNSYGNKIVKNMKKYILSLIMLLSINLYALDCPADSSYHTDLRTLLPNGSPNPTFNQMIATGLCGCIGFSAELSGIEEDSTLTLSLVLLDNEPIRGAQIDIFHDAGSALSYDEGGNVVKGDKLEDLDDPTTPTVIESMTLLANEMDGFVRVMAYSTSRANTAGDGMEGTLFHLTFKAVNGLSSLPATVSYHASCAIVSNFSLSISESGNNSLDILVLSSALLYLPIAFANTFMLMVMDFITFSPVIMWSLTLCLETGWSFIHFSPPIFLYRD